jgi:hypothetical protein
MTNWEYAAIVGFNVSMEEYLPEGVHSENDPCTMWALVQPGNESHLIEKTPYRKGRDKPRSVGGMTKFVKVAHTWTRPSETKARIEQAKLHNNDPDMLKISTKWNVNEDSMPIVLYETDDILKLVNIAGKDGWEITGGLGLNDGYWRHINEGGPIRENRWRMMRREL